MKLILRIVLILSQKARRAQSPNAGSGTTSTPRSWRVGRHVLSYIDRDILMNVTYPTALVLEAIAAGVQHGFDIMDTTGLPSGSVYPILRRLEHEGLVRSRWEKHEIAQREGRPPRR